MKLILKYLSSRFRIILLLFLSAGAFAGIIYLYKLPGQTAVYGMAVCAVIWIMFGAVDFAGFARKHKLLSKLSEQAELSESQLPPPSGLIESDYSALVKAVSAAEQKLADEMTRRTSEMTDYVSLWTHEIKTPIAAMRLLLQTEDIPQGEELSENLRKTEHYAEMVMCYLRLDSGSTDYLIKRYELDGIIRTAVRGLSKQFIRKRIKLRYEPLECEVLTDEKWLLFVLEQVLSNALKYTNEGEIAIYLEQPLTLCVSDTGIGIRAEDLPRIFEKSFTGCNGRIDRRASGIGLYLCKRICKALGHEISAQSELGKGTIVRIKLDETKLEIE